MANISLFTVDRSIIVGHLDGGFLCYFPDYISFSFDHDHLVHDIFYLHTNRLNHKNEKIPFTGSFTGTYCGIRGEGPNVKLVMNFKFEDGFLGDKDLIIFDMT